MFGELETVKWNHEQTVSLHDNLETFWQPAFQKNRERDCHNRENPSDFPFYGTIESVTVEFPVEDTYDGHGTSGKGDDDGLLISQQRMTLSFSGRAVRCHR